MTRLSITRAYVRKYTDTGQVKAYVEWSDGSTTEGDVRPRCPCCGAPARKGKPGLSTHMTALFDRAMQLGIQIERETW